MHFSTAALLAFAASVVAQNPLFNPITRPLAKEEVAEGSTFAIKWTTPEQFADVTVSISLIGGPEQDKQQHLVDIASGVANSAESYDWTVPSGLPRFPWYGIKMVSEENEADFQFSNPFLVVADPNADPASSGAASTTTVTTGYGTATVTLSSVSTTSTSSSVESSSSIESSSVEATTSAPATTLTRATTTSASTSSATESEPAESSGPAQVGDSSATNAKASFLAIAGGLAVALML